MGLTDRFAETSLQASRYSIQDPKRRMSRVMSLNFTGEEGSSERFETLLEAYDGEKRVVVVSSTEAIDDFGLEAVQQKASDKYDAQQFDENGRVKVFKNDFIL